MSKVNKLIDHQSFAEGIILYGDPCEKLIELSLLSGLLNKKDVVKIKITAGNIKRNTWYKNLLLKDCTLTREQALNALECLLKNPFPIVEVK